MRALTEAEATKVMEKLYKYIGKRVAVVVEGEAGAGGSGEPQRHCFRLNKNRVYYIKESLVRRAARVQRRKLMSLGTQIGKFTKTNNFRLTIHSLDLLARHAKNKIWLKPQAEQSFLYGNNVNKSGMGKITEDTERNDGVVFLNMADVPLGFGTSARNTLECRKLDPGAIIAYHQADIGEYLRSEEDL